jgi:hypothetical protein
MQRTVLPNASTVPVEKESSRRANFDSNFYQIWEKKKQTIETNEVVAVLSRSQRLQQRQHAQRGRQRVNELIFTNISEM